MTDVLESVLRGLGTGSVYALLALGFVIIYKATRVISFAQPALMLAGVVMVTLPGRRGSASGWPSRSPPCGTGVLALGVERVAVRPMVGRPAFVVAIITLGVDVAVRVVVNVFIGLDVRHVDDPWGLRTVGLVRRRHAAAAPRRADRHGGAGRRAVRLLPIQPDGAGDAGGRRTTRRPRWPRASRWARCSPCRGRWPAGSRRSGARSPRPAGASTPRLWLIALTALPVIILGGLDSLPGAVIGGLAVGVLQELAANYQNHAPWLGGNVSVITPYVVMLVVLLVRPYGLFGTREVERV